MIKHLGQQKAIVVGHDWGGVVAWQLAINVPQVVDRLIILNLPHPRGLSRELAHNPEQQKNSAYARRFQTEGAEKSLTAEGLAGWVKDPEAKKKYVEAFGRSDFDGDAELLQAELPARAVHRRHLAGEEGPVSGADDPRARRHGAAVAGAERYVGLGGEGPDDHDDSRRRPLRSGRRRRIW